MTQSTKETLMYFVGLLFVWLIGFSMGLGAEYSVEKQEGHIDSCEDAIFQRTLSFKLDDWEVRARKKLGDQWLCYEIGELEMFSYLKIRVVFVLKKNDEVMK